MTDYRDDIEYLPEFFLKDPDFVATMEAMGRRPEPIWEPETRWEAFLGWVKALLLVIAGDVLTPSDPPPCQPSREDLERERERADIERRNAEHEERERRHAEWSRDQRERQLAEAAAWRDRHAAWVEAESAYARNRAKDQAALQELLARQARDLRSTHPMGRGVKQAQHRSELAAFKQSRPGLWY